MEAAFEQEIEALFGENDPAYNAQLQVDDIDIGEKIVNIAKRKKADLLFMGLKRQSKVGKFLFGSTAQHVLLNAPCPVVTVNPV
jgi:nucleotide-binding universal stress UspA family protein